MVMSIKTLYKVWWKKGDEKDFYNFISFEIVSTYEIRGNSSVVEFGRETLSFVWDKSRLTLPLNLVLTSIANNDLRRDSRESDHQTEK